MWDGAIQGLNKALAGWRLRQERTKQSEEQAERDAREKQFRDLIFGAPEGTTFKDVLRDNPDIAGSDNLGSYASLWQIINPQDKTKNIAINGKLVDPRTGEVIGDYSDEPDKDWKTDDKGRPYHIDDKGEVVFGQGAIGKNQPAGSSNKPSWNKDYNRWERYNPQTGQMEVVEYADGTPEVSEEAPNLSFDEKIKVATSLSRETAQLAGSTLDIQKFYMDGLNAAAQNTQAGDHALAFAFSKILDEGSVVRESEVKAILGLQNVEGGLISYFKKMISDNGQLTPQLKANLLAVMKDAFVSSVRNYDIIHNQQLAKAKRYGIDPRNITDLINREIYQDAIKKEKETPETTITGRTLGPTIGQAQDTSRGLTPEQTLQTPKAKTSGIEVVDKEGNSHYVIQPKTAIYKMEPEQLTSYNDDLTATFGGPDGQAKFESLTPEEQESLIWFREFYSMFTSKMEEMLK